MKIFKNALGQFTPNPPPKYMITSTNLFITTRALVTKNWNYLKTKLGLQSLSYAGPSTWNKLPNAVTSKTVTSVNGLKHDINK